MATKGQGAGDKIKDEIEDTKEGIEETYEQRPGKSAGEKIGGIFKQAVEDVKEAGHASGDEKD
jgi:hypothetical protein